jgi:hypothetical protein
MPLMVRAALFASLCTALASSADCGQTGTTSMQPGVQVADAESRCSRAAVRAKSMRGIARMA